LQPATKNTASAMADIVSVRISFSFQESRIVGL